MPEALLTLEAAQAADVARRQLVENAAIMAGLAGRLRVLKPAFVATCARGSSDHAATYGKYLIERTLGLPVASLGPSLASVYGGEPNLRGGLFIAISQSGRSPDALRLTEAAKRGGALVVGLINDEVSPLADIVDVLVPLRAGPETSVAATKTFLAACFALLHLTASWSGDSGLLQACNEAPCALDRAGGCDWSAELARLNGAASLYVVGRGWGLGIAQEMALKFKETCRIHAEAFSAAEVLHGPLALVGPGFPAIVLDPGDEGEQSTTAVARRMLELGAHVAHAGRASSLDETLGASFAGSSSPGASLPMPDGLAPALVPLAQIRAFYGAIAALARARGFDPDRPQHLLKVTQTV